MWLIKGLIGFLIIWCCDAAGKNETSENVRVRIGHIGAQNVMPKAEAIIEICRKELWTDGILSDDFDIE